MKRALIVAPHQDDETIGCGGTAAMLRNNGWTIGVVHVFLGNSGGELDDNSEARAQEARSAGGVIGFELLPNLGYRDREHDDVASLARSLTQQFREYRPSLVFLPHTAESDYEHVLVARAGSEASWLTNAGIFPGSSRHEVGLVLCYEVWSAIASPALYVDITEQLPVKRLALERYASQMASRSWLDGAIGHNAKRGCTLQGHGYAEAFGMHPCSLRTAGKILESMYGTQ